ncbi:hypothetical protein O3M35_013250 [Rhynocoris fuscipes]|uniref:3'-5' exonuclease domain-containing protein n=1 Tax=Rhynocoris fuscipes TaxID=488301 RepID=A0AAW1CFC5_9HEMI
MDTAQYESVKNRTVLFFYERLIEKGGRRSLHDLSCQFGAKEFTNDMRRIAGGTESTLRKFLSERPHLFTLDGDMVNIKKRDAPTRDIREEAVQYFSNKLRQYGEGTEVPIKTLFGHRSQASREIRHICGQQIDEFRTFLSMNSNDFILYEDNVKLKEYACTKPQPEPEAVKVDSAASSHLLNFFKLCIDIKGPLPADQLYNHVQTLFPEDVWSPIFKTPQDLLSFIRIHSNLFNVRARTIYSAQRTDCKYIKSNTNINNNNDINNNNSGSSITTASSPPVVPTENITDSSINFRKTALAKGVNSSVRKVQAATAGNDGNIASVSVQEDNWNAQVLQRTKIIANTKECLDLVEDILASEERTVISFDCKGINLGEKGLITQIEIGLTNGEAYILDLVTSPNLVVAGGLKRLLQSKKVLKVIHDCSSVSLNLYNQYGITLNNVFDTQVANLKFVPFTFNFSTTILQLVINLFNLVNINPIQFYTVHM